MATPTTPPKKTIYTFGDHYYHTNEIISMAQYMRINCIINISGEENSQIPTDIRNNNILYSCFWQYFEGILQYHTDNKGRISYEEAMQDEKYMQGIQRITNGIEQGYRIMLLDHTENTSKSIRFKLLGKTLSQSYNVIHIITPTKLITQEQLLLQIAQQKEQSLRKKKIAAQVGIAGEEIAGLYLMQNKFRILDHNWNLHRGCEIDIVAYKDNKLHFVEVKTRTSDRYGTPESAITPQKMRNIRKAAIEYRYLFKLTHIDFQIDSIAIIYRSDTDYDIKYFPDIQQYAISKNYRAPYHNH